MSREKFASLITSIEQLRPAFLPGKRRFFAKRSVRGDNKSEVVLPIWLAERPAEFLELAELLF